MAKIFRPSTREASILSRIESSKERLRRQTINAVRDYIDPLSNALAMKLVEGSLVETTNKNGLEEQIYRCLDILTRAEDFDVDYQVSPIRKLIQNPNIVSLYVTSFVIEKLIDHRDTVDIYGSDEDIYHCINQQVIRILP